MFLEDVGACACECEQGRNKGRFGGDDVRDVVDTAEGEEYERGDLEAGEGEFQSD